MINDWPPYACHGACCLGWHDEGPVEVVIAHLARGLGYKRATVTSGTVQPASLHAPARRVLSADRIVRTKRTDPTIMANIALPPAGVVVSRPC